MPENCNAIAIFQFTTNLEQSKTHIFINGSFYLTKKWKQK